MSTLTEILVEANNYYNEKRAKRSGRNPHTGSRFGADFETNYKVFNEDLTLKRPKRQGINPSVGGFIAYSRGGGVKLNVCQNFGDRALCIHIPDSTNYRAIAPNYEEPTIPFKDGVEPLLIVRDLETADLSLSLIDAYENQVDLSFNEIEDNIALFNAGNCEIYVDIDTSEVTQIVNNGDTYTDVIFKRREDGRVLIVGTRNGIDTDTELYINVSMLD